MRQIVLDTETTGLDPTQGHRIIEIGCVELLNRKFTGNNYHVYINPEREIDEGAIEVHGITNEFLADRPVYTQIADEFLEYIRGAELVIHNAPFDVGFMDAEFDKISGMPRTNDVCKVLDTLTMARAKHPGQRNSLDALCKRYGIDNSHRDLHGALLDAEILADVYLRMTGGQTALSLAEESKDNKDDKTKQTIKPIDRSGGSFLVVSASDSEKDKHAEVLEWLDSSAGGAKWRQYD